MNLAAEEQHAPSAASVTIQGERVELQIGLPMIGTLLDAPESMDDDLHLAPTGPALSTYVEPKPLHAIDTCTCSP